MGGLLLIIEIEHREFLPDLLLLNFSERMDNYFSSVNGGLPSMERCNGKR